MDLTHLKNKFADLFYKNKITAVYIKEVKEKRIHIILPSGKEELINYSALISFEEKTHSLKDLNQILEFLKEKQEKREKLKENFEAFLAAIKKASPAGVKGAYLKQIVVCSTMGPGVKIEI